MVTEYKVRALVVKEEPGEYTAETPNSVLKFWNDFITQRDWYDPEKEQVVVLALNTKLKIKGYNLVSLGTVSESLVAPREVFRPLIALSAYGFILIHNHPSGETTPSLADGKITRKLKECGELIGIPLFDHVIVGGEGRFSFREAGVI